MQFDPDRGRARRYIEAKTRQILAEAGGRRMRRDHGVGARAPASLAAAPLRLVTLTQPRPGGRVEPVTPPGYRTAVRALPPLLAGLSAQDPRRLAAAAFEASAAQIGAVRGVSLEGADTSGGISDGGVTTRIKHAARLRLIEAMVNGWGVDRAHGVVQRGPARVAMRVQRPCAGRKEITAMALLSAVCVEGADLGQILRAHGWSAQTRNRRVLATAALDLLADLAAALGYCAPR